MFWLSKIAERRSWPQAGAIESFTVKVSVKEKLWMGGLFSLIAI